MLRASGFMHLGYYNLFPKSLPFPFTDSLPTSLPYLFFHFRYVFGRLYLVLQCALSWFVALVNVHERICRDAACPRFGASKAVSGGYYYSEERRQIRHDH